MNFMKNMDMLLLNIEIRQASFEKQTEEHQLRQL